MPIKARIASNGQPERRAYPRLASDFLASARKLGANGSMNVIDMTTHGCRFPAEWSPSVGTRILLSLPGLEPWLATVAWTYGAGGGLEFDRPLHPKVAERFIVAGEIAEPANWRKSALG